MDQKPRKRLRAWLERQSQRQADGTYLIRPFRPMPVIYEVDTETNRRWISYQTAFGRFAWLWLITYLLVGLRWRWGLPVWLAVLLLAGYGWPLILVRGAHRVPRNRWIGPAVVDPAGRYSRATRAIWLVVSLALTVILAYAGLSGRYGPLSAETVGLTILFAACVVVFAARVFRR